MHTELLDHGYIELVETWGSDERIIEAARMSTAKGFLGWGPLACACAETETPGKVAVQLRDGWIGDGLGDARVETTQCPKCHGSAQIPGDEKLLAYLWNNNHATPFEMAGAIVEVQAPIFVFREWHRHRTQSYNELSARYTPLPDIDFSPSWENLHERGLAAAANRQASSIAPYDEVRARAWFDRLPDISRLLEEFYREGLDAGVPKELARIRIPVGRYSRMRASANLRNWLAFLTLRQAPNAQWEIRQYANALAEVLTAHFPRTMALFAGRA